MKLPSLHESDAFFLLHELAKADFKRFGDRAYGWAWVDGRWELQDAGDHDWMPIEASVIIECIEAVVAHNGGIIASSGVSVEGGYSVAFVSFAMDHGTISAAGTSFRDASLRLFKKVWGMKFHKPKVHVLGDSTRKTLKDL